MKTITRGPSINTHIALLLIAGWIALLIGGSVVINPTEGTRSPDSSIHAAAIAEQTDTTNGLEQTALKTKPAAAGDSNTNIAKWTFIVYADADDNILEEAAINSFLDMASIGSNDNVNIVMQLDRTPEYATSYDDWTDCRRFLVTKGLTPANGNEIMNLGEVNMGDPKTLVDFAEWTITNYPAEKYALVLSGHGKGWMGLCWDLTSGNDNLEIKELKTALAEVTTYNGRPLDLIGFDSCLMSMTEVVYEIHDYVAVMVASEETEPSAGWPYTTILANVIDNPDMNAAQLGSVIVDSYYESHKAIGYTMAAIDLTRIDTVVNGLNDLSVSMLSTADNSGSIKTIAQELTAAIDGAVINEKHGSRWAGSHGLGIYFPKTIAKFDSDYNAYRIALANDTSWDEFLTGYATSADSTLIASARAEAQQYSCTDYIDLYSFCQNLVAAQ